MTIKNILNSIDIVERVDLELRSLYKDYGFKPFKMGKFEEYDLYTKNKDFIPTDSIITVTGQDGKLLALRPDLTLSIVKYFRPEEKEVEKLYYSENIYRSDKTGSYNELRQTGLECLGIIGIDEISEVTRLAALSLKMISKNYILDISHMGFLQELISDIPERAKKPILKAVSQKNSIAIREIASTYGISEEKESAIEAVTSIYGEYKKTLPLIKELPLSDKARQYICDIEKVCKYLSDKKVGGIINIDFSIVNNMTYYSGILFQGYIPGIPENILSGGQYDGVMERMRKSGSAIGFALYLDFLRGIEDSLEGNRNSRNNRDNRNSAEGTSAKSNSKAGAKARLEDVKKKTGGIGNNKTEKTGLSDDEYINVALPKGRLGTKIYEMFEKAGYPCSDIKEDNRRLVFENKRKKIRYFWVKPSDVTVYVERGTADIGACGKDIIEEYSPDVYELLDLKKGKCKMCVAAKKGFADDTSKTLRVATKFPEIARKYYEGESRKIDIIKLHGSIELAPILDMSDVILDIVETGKTLKENNLDIIEEVLPVSARLIANKSAFRFKNDRITELISKLVKRI